MGMGSWRADLVYQAPLWILRTHFVCHFLLHFLHSGVHSRCTEVMSKFADIAYIASIEMHMMIPLQECIVIVLLSVHAARSLGIWERLLAVSRPESSPFQLCHQQHVAAEPNRRRLV